MWHKYTSVSAEPFRLHLQSFSNENKGSRSFRKFDIFLLDYIPLHIHTPCPQSKILNYKVSNTTAIWKAWSETQHSLFLVETEIFNSTVSARLHIWFLSKAAHYGGFYRIDVSGCDKAKHFQFHVRNKHVKPHSTNQGSVIPLCYRVSC